MTQTRSRDDLSELEDFATALKRGDGDGVSAASLDRAYRLGRDAKAQSWALVEIGPRLTGGLIHGMRLRYTRLRGKQVNEEGEIESELYLFVYGISARDADTLARRDRQDAYLYSGVETDWSVHQVDLKNGRTIDLGRFHSRTIGKSWSETRGWPNHAFVFDKWTKPDCLLIEALVGKSIHEALWGW